MSTAYNPIRNRLLAALHPDDLAVLLPHVEYVELAVREPIEEANAPIEDVYFPEAGIISIVACSPEGEQLEVGLIGREGMPAVSLLLGADRTPNRSFVQIAGRAIRLPAAALRAAITERRSLHRTLLLYAQAASVQLACTALANGRYAIEERLARWLLMSHDRTEDPELPMTHEFLSLMLGVRRAGVTTALHILEGGGAIRAVRALIIVRDRQKLVDVAGDCYGMPEREYERLFGA